MLRLKKALWFLVALIFLVEAWLWDIAQPLIRRLVALIGWEHLRAWLSRAIEKLPPWATLLVFAVPDILLVPVKIGALWLSAKGQVIVGMTIFITAKLVGVAVTLFLFEICRPKLMQMAWFARVHDWFAAARAWARLQIEPAMRLVRLWKLRILGERSRVGRILRWLRRRSRQA